MVHRDSTYFGPRLWLNAYVDNPAPPPPLPPRSQEMLTFEPIVLSNFPPPPTADSASATNEVGGDKLTNENLLKSIGFIPGSSDAEPEVPSEPTSTDDLMISSSTEKLLQTFEVIRSPSHAPSEPRPLPGGGRGGDEMVEDDFVMIVPDCFDLSKPLADFTPPPSLTYAGEDLPESSYPDLQPSRSCDSHVSSVVMVPGPPADSAAQRATPPPSEAPLADRQAGSEPLPVTSQPRPLSPPQDCTPKAAGPESPKSSPPTAHRSPALAPSRLSMRTLKGGLYRNPLAVATGLVNAVSGFVDEKVHFSGAAEGKEKVPHVKFSTPDESDTSDEEFEVSVCV